MARCQFIVVIIFLLLHINFIVSRFVTTHEFEAENMQCFGSCKEMTRSAASNGRTVFIKLNDGLRDSLEIKSNCSISVGNCRYSTDSPLPDRVNISFASTNIGSFTTTTQEGNGHLWNVFKDSGPVGKHLQLPSGRYTLVLFLTVDPDDLGVEIDKTTLNFNCDADPGLVETNNNMNNGTLTPMTDVLSVGEKVGIGIGVVAAVAAVATALIAVITFYFQCKKRWLDS